MTERSLIRLKHITYTYPGSALPVLKDLHLEIQRGDRIGLMAPNGSGKTTLFHAIMGLCKPDSGTIEIFGETRTCEKDFAEIRTRIGLLFQDADDQLFSPTVLEDVAFGPLNLGFSKTEAVDIARKTLASLDLYGFEDRITHHLSGGQKRLIALAAVLAMKPEMLLLDEPTAGLDSTVKEHLVDVLTGLDITYIVVSHEFNFLTAVTTQLMSMENGRILSGDEIHVHQHEHMHKLGKHPHRHV